MFFYSGGPSAALIPNPNSPNTTLSTAAAINNNGQVVGEARYQVTPQSTLNVAYLYSESGGVKNLGALPGGGTEYRDVQPFGINNSGQVVGYSTTTSGAYHYSAFLYSGNGPMQDLGPLIGSGGGSSAYGINDSGQIVGRRLPSGEGYRAFLYNSSSGRTQDLGTLGGTGTYSCAYSINNKGQIVGMADAAVNDEHAFVFKGNGPMQDLNDLIDPSLGVTLQVATAINDNGQIIAYSSTSHVFLLTPNSEPSPIPEPTTLIVWSLLGALGIGLGWWRRRKAR